ncbi:fascin domain-containing protein [Gracilimonas mengyeensis]|uniref:Uncharacterized protein n=1 Tax=Gracilimonas mengyeensis TaxID=1302730 RepID=A0A521D7U0_9BACT|nr:hypothetical protein [Gracilimonas mengyeensis]SMO67776.1 hypothetical protein SAMN06265219_107194 [Gracilimonas mengyeensis]
MGTTEVNEHTIADYSNGDVFLRLDGSGVTNFMPDGGGEVNCQVTAGPWEKFKLAKGSDGYYTIESIAFPGVFLRMDGRNVSEANPTGGVVNCQFGAGPWEKFKLTTHQYGYSIESVAFPGVFLRMNSDNCEKNSAPGCGQVNCSWGTSTTTPIREWFIIAPPVQLSKTGT